MQSKNIVLFGILAMLLVLPILTMADDGNSAAQDPLNPLQRVYVNYQYDSKLNDLNNSVQAASALDNNTFTIPVSDAFVNDPNAENLTITTTGKTITISDDAPYKMLYSVAIPYSQIEHLVKNGQVIMIHFDDSGKADTRWVQNVSNVNGYAVFESLPFTSVTIYPITAANWTNMNFETYTGYVSGNAPSGWTKYSDASTTGGLDLSTDAASGARSLQINANPNNQFSGYIYQENQPNEQLQYTNISFDVKQTGATAGSLMVQCEDSSIISYERIGFDDLISGQWTHYEFTTTQAMSWYYALSIYTQDYADGVWQVDNIVYGNRSSASATETNDGTHYYQTFTYTPPEVFTHGQIVTRYSTINLSSMPITSVTATVDGVVKPTYQRGALVYIDTSGISAAAHTIVVTATTSSAYIPNYGNNTVAVTNVGTGVISQYIPVGTQPYGVAVNSLGTKVYITNSGSNTVSVINAATNTVAATVAVGSHPQGVAATPDGTKVYVANNGTNTVSVINAATNTVSSTITVGSNPVGVAVSPDGANAYVTNYNDGTVSVINTATGTVTNTMSSSLFGGSAAWIRGIVVSPDSGKIYVASYHYDKIYAVTSAGAAIGSVASGSANDVAINPAGTKLYSTSYNGQNLHVSDASTLTAIATVAMGTSSGTEGVSVDPSGAYCYVLTRTGSTGNALYKVATATNTITATYYGFNAPYAMGTNIMKSVSTAPTASFTVNPISTNIGGTLQFSDTSTNTPTSWAWTFGDGGTSTIQNPTHAYTSAGTYSIGLTVTNAMGSNTFTQPNYVTITTATIPVVAFSGSPLSGNLPLTVQFTDSSSNTPTSWSWNFGDGSTSTIKNPTHVYTAAGLYSITLSATNSYGSNTLTKTSYIVVATTNTSSGGLAKGVWRNGDYTVTNFNGSYWSRAAWLVGGNQGLEDLTCAAAWEWQENGATVYSCNLPFTGTDTSTISYSSSEMLAPLLDQAQADGRQVILNIQPEFADPSTVIDLVLTHYSAYTNIIGINIDLEWKRTGVVEKCTNTERDAWMAAVKRHLPNGKLFLITYRDSSYLPTDTTDLVILFDGLGDTQTNILSEYTALTTNYATCGLYTGYPQNTPTRSASDSAIITAQPTKTKYILHVEYDAGETPIALDWGGGSGGGGSGGSSTYFGNGPVGSFFVGSQLYGTILQMDDTLENSQVQPKWDYIEYLDDGRGYTVGFCGFCSGTYDANVMIKYYTTLNSSNVLAKYIPALNAIDAGAHNDAGGDGNDDITGLSGMFGTDGTNGDWARAYREDPANFVKAQLYEWNMIYWYPAYSQWVSVGGKTNLTLAIIVNAALRYGTDSSYGSQYIINQVNSNLGGSIANGKNEQAWDTEFLRIYTNLVTAEALGDETRCDGFKDILTAHNYNLVVPYSFDAYGDIFTITGNLGIPDYWSTGGGGGTVVKPVASFTANPISGSTPLTVRFVDTSTNTPTSYLWNFGDGGTSTAQSPSHTYSSAGSYTITYTATNSAGSSTITKSGYIVVTTGGVVFPSGGTITWGGHTFDVKTGTSNPGPDVWNGTGVWVDTTNRMHMTITHPSSWQASEIDTQGTYNYGIYKWVVEYPNPATLNNNVVFGMFKYTDANNEVDIQNGRFQNGSANPLWFSAQPSDSIGNSKSYALANSPQPITYIIDVQAARVIYTAKYADGTTAGSWTYTGSAIPKVAGKVCTNLWYYGSGPSNSQPVEFILDNFSISQAKPVANFANTVNGATVQFNDTSVSIPTTWSWNFGDGYTSTSQNPSHTYATAGTYSVVLTASNYYGTSTKTVSVTSTSGSGTSINADFTANVTSGGVPLRVLFTDISTGSPTSWLWDFGDGITSSHASNATHTYTKAGVYTTTLTVSDSRYSDVAIKTGYISVGAVSNFTATPTSGNVPMAVAFTDLTTGSPTSWAWNFGDGNTSTSQNPTHTYVTAGTYSVTLVTTSVAGTNTTTQSNYITVGAPVAVQAVFFANTQEIQPNHPVQFMSNSTGAIESYQWDFGDGITSTEPNPTHKYMREGSYNVTLTASGYGTTSTSVMNSYVNVSKVVNQNYSQYANKLFGNHVNESTGWDIAENGYSMMTDFVPANILWAIVLIGLIFIPLANRQNKLTIPLMLVATSGYILVKVLPSFLAQYELWFIGLTIAGIFYTLFMSSRD